MKIGKIECHPVTFGASDKKGKKDYINFREKIRKECKKLSKRIEDKQVDIKIKLFIKRNRIRSNKNDLDNFLKPIIDGICDFKNKNIDKKEGISILKNESQIRSILIERIPNDIEGVYIEII
jgi:Holliday junction resolvase RusA-like endonuclease